MIWQSALVVVVCYLDIYLDFSNIYYLFYAVTMIMMNKDYHYCVPQSNSYR